MTREAERHFDALYEGQPAWVLGTHQPHLEILRDQGRFQRLPSLDLGAGTGHNAAFLEASGVKVHGVDISRRAIAVARTVSPESTFEATDLLQLQVDTPYQQAFDLGVWHIFDDPERRKYQAMLQRVLAPGATFHLLCFRDDEPHWGGPRRIAKAELETWFGFLENLHIEPAQYQVRVEGALGRAWYLYGQMPERPSSGS